jgi:hypothetical protein
VSHQCLATVWIFIRLPTWQAFLSARLPNATAPYYRCFFSIRAKASLLLASQHLPSCCIGENYYFMHFYRYKGVMLNLETFIFTAEKFSYNTSFRFLPL